MWHSGTWVTDGHGSAGLMLDPVILKVFPASVIIACSGNSVIPNGMKLTLLCPGHVWACNFTHGFVPVNFNYVLKT